MPPSTATYVHKACAYITRSDGELLVFDGPEYEGKQVPKGTLDDDESPREALQREVYEETGLDDLDSVEHLQTDLWQRREGRWYVRHFFHARVDDPREEWVHTVTGEGEEVGDEYECTWVTVSERTQFALDLDEYLYLLPLRTSTSSPTPQSTRS
ncbi:NUDIX domain-containing protein [Natranaeroarchaeum aerophilus]|uniref:NUDIX domain-containing protein n=1 Tax=Natranaeroarchaeum aerophilus TaxID=2917711 RepID=A0AAE3FPL9_9EURY|nr:NUDIX domain-containing protein [Natranaeroarchaeum aerophilus]MCL9812826.1 NUDIX domain-containing protein [Natranaeroarchaeum aerophilus]